MQSVGGDIEWNRDTEQLIVRGGKKSRKGIGCAGRLSTQNLPDGILRVNCAGFPDAVPALSVAACFIEGTTVIEDIAVCRRKETDRIEVMKSELTKLGATVEEGPDYIIIHGHSPINEDGSVNEQFAIHGGTVESFDDHRVAMSFAVLGLAMDTPVIVKEAECCAVSFPDFFEAMNGIGAKIKCE